MPLVNRALTGVAAAARVIAQGRVDAPSKPGTLFAAGAVLVGLGLLSSVAAGSLSAGVRAALAGSGLSRAIAMGTFTPGGAVGTDNPNPNFRYVGPTAAGTGDGTSWANRARWSTLTFQRGLTYYLMDGSYGAGRTLSTPPASTTPITIKKATALDHGMNAGFNTSTMGSGQAVFTGGFSFTTSYWIIDGTTGGGPGQWETGFGIFFNMPTGTGQSWCFDFASGCTGITFRHLDVYGRGASLQNAAGDPIETDIFYIVNPVSNILIEYCHLRDVSRCMILTWPSGSSGITLQYCKLARNGTAEHREAWSAGTDSNIVIRHNLFEDILGTGVIAIVNGNGDATNWNIYGNVIYWTAAKAATNAIINTGILVTAYQPAAGFAVRAVNWNVFNNVIANVRGASYTAAFNFEGPIVNVVARNNIWYNNLQGAGAGQATTKSHNWFYANGSNDASGASDIVGTSSPFVDSAPWTTGNWALKAAIPGFALPAPYDTDMLGKVRGADGTFDRGVIEYTPVFYVRQGASGNGSDWSNAYGALPATLQRGATYYVADGQYGGYNFNTANNGTQVITIKKATIADHGTTVGWLDTYGDGEALFQDNADVVFNLQPSRGYLVVDGNFGDGFAPGGYGFRFRNTASRNGTACIIKCDTGGLASQTGGNDNITFRCVELDFNNGTGVGSAGVTRCVQMNTALANNNITFERCYMHHSSGFGVYADCVGSGWIIDGCHVELNGGGVDDHHETFWLTSKTNLIFRNNVLRDPVPGAFTGWVMVGDVSNAQFYNNIFYCTNPAASLTGGNGIIGTWSHDYLVNDGVYIFHNTFYNLPSSGNPAIYFDHDNAVDTNIVVQNNLIVTQSFGFTGATTASHNAFGGGAASIGTSPQAGLASAVFQNVAAGDFRIKQATNPGVLTSPPIATDRQGAIRVNRDRGAYEFV